MKLLLDMENDKESPTANNGDMTHIKEDENEHKGDDTVNNLNQRARAHQGFETIDGTFKTVLVKGESSKTFDKDL